MTVGGDELSDAIPGQTHDGAIQPGDVGTDNRNVRRLAGDHAREHVVGEDHVALKDENVRKNALLVQMIEADGKGDDVVRGFELVIRDEAEAFGTELVSDPFPHR